MNYGENTGKLEIHLHEGPDWKLAPEEFIQGRITVIVAFDRPSDEAHAGAPRTSTF